MTYNESLINEKGEAELFLEEALNPRMLTGMAVALLGTALVTRLLPRPHARTDC